MSRKPKKAKRPKPPKVLSSTLVPPEGVPLTFRTAGLGVRLGAQIIDLLLTTVFVIAVIILLAFGFDAPGDLIMSVAALMFFLIRTPYYVLTELLWNGATLGKQMLKLRVVSADGRTLTPHAVVVRNLMKEAEVFLPGAMLLGGASLEWWGNLLVILWITLLLAVPLRNPKRQRLGDLIAGTYVIHMPVTTLIPDLSVSVRKTATDQFVFQPNQLDHYGAYELQTLETVLQTSLSLGASVDTVQRRRKTIEDITERVRRKIDYGEQVAPKDAELFLRAFYNAQRAHLEQRQLFGDKRVDKFHRADDPR